MVGSFFVLAMSMITSVWLTIVESPVGRYASAGAGLEREEAGPQLVGRGDRPLEELDLELAGDCAHCVD